MSKMALNFANASCAHCARLVTKTLSNHEGVRYVEVDRDNEQVLVDFDPNVTSVDSIRALLERAGYPTRLAERSTPAHLRQLVGAREG